MTPPRNGSAPLEAIRFQPPSDVRDERRNVEINVGRPCNNKCVFCLDGFPKGDKNVFMPFEDMKAELARWAGEGHRSVGFLGGEPTIYPDIVEAVAHARKVGFTRVTIATNSTQLRRPAFADQLIGAGLTRVTVSMHGHTAELEDRLTRVPGNFEKKCTALRYLVARHREGLLPDGVSVNVVLNGWNYRHLLAMERFFFETLGLPDIRINFIRPEGWAEGSSDLVPRYAEAVPLLVKAIMLNEFHYKRILTFGGFPLCVLPPKLARSAGFRRKYMGEYRDLSTDCSIKQDGAGHGIAKVEGGRARFNWQERKRRDLKHQPDACEACEMSPICEGVWNGYLDIHGTGEFRPVAPESNGNGVFL
jgi:MoaA/NifB/PqqE/SkfB family radical SAM enzyme